MATISRADAVWEGDLMSGKGRVKVASGAFNEFGVTWASRADREKGGTSPEELIAAAHAACYSMALSNGLAKAGHQPERLTTSAEVEFVPGKGIVSSTITVRGHIHGLSAGDFQKFAEEAKDGCPVSQALKGNVQLNLKAELDHVH
ncbi:MAG: OsmC family peroxiredoxin [Chloroflexi bacterium]|nr:MAG: OsmC family peroxiredoxin [Chloroflexota bacterium]